MSNPQSLDQNVKKLNDRIHEIVDDSKDLIRTLPSVVITLMKTLEDFTHLRGEQKREVLIIALTRYFEIHNLNKTVLEMLPDFIESALLLDKKQIIIKAINAGKNCLTCLWKACTKKQ